MPRPPSLWFLRPCGHWLGRRCFPGSGRRGTAVLGQVNGGDAQVRFPRCWAVFFQRSPAVPVGALLFTASPALRPGPPGESSK